MADQDILDLMGLGESNAMGSDSDYYDTGVDSIDSLFLDSPIDKARKKNDKRLEKIAEEHARQLKDYEDAVKSKPSDRAKDIYKKNIKSTFGFTPDNTGKKVAAGALDTVMSLLPFFGPVLGFQRAKANIRGAQEYNQVTDAYKALMSSASAGDRTENSLYKNNLDLAAIEEKNALAKERNKISSNTLDFNKDRFNQQHQLAIQSQQFKEFMGARGIELKQEQLDAMKPLWEAQAAKAKAQSDNQELKNQGEMELKQIADRYGVPVDWVRKNSPEGMAIMLSDPEQAKKMGGSKVLDVYDFMKRGSGQGGGETVRTTPIYKPGVGGAPTFDRMEVTRIPKSGTARKNPLLNDPLEGLNPIAQEAVGPKQTIAQKLAQTITKPGAITPPSTATGTDPLEQQANEIFQKPVRVTDIRSTAGGTKSGADNMRKWESLRDRSDMLYQNAAADLGSGKLKNWVGAIPKMSLMDGLRAMNGGKSDSEINDEIQHTFIGLEHLKQRGGGGRVAEQMYNKFMSTLSNKLDSPETYVRRLGVQKMMIEFGHLQENDPRFQGLVDAYNKAYNANPKKGASLAEIINDSIEDSVKQTKKSKVVQIPSVEKAIRLGFQRLKAGSPEDDSNLSDWEKTKKAYGIGAK